MDKLSINELTVIFDAEIFPELIFEKINVSKKKPQLLVVNQAVAKAPQFHSC